MLISYIFYRIGQYHCRSIIQQRWDIERERIEQVLEHGGCPSHDHFTRKDEQDEIVIKENINASEASENFYKFK